MQQSIIPNNNESKPDDKILSPIISIKEITDKGRPLSSEDENEFVSLDISEIEPSGKIECNQNVENNTQTLQQQIARKQQELEKIKKQLQSATINNEYDGGEIVTIDVKLTTDKSASDNSKQLNWPHPSFPYIYHDIQNEIPESKQYLVTTAYNCWKLTAIGLFLNFITINIASFHDNYYESGISKSQNVFTSLLWFIMITPSGFFFWYLNLYKISTKFSTKNWLIFIVTFTIHILFTLIMLSGCPWYPCAGLFFIITCFFSGYVLSTIFAVMNGLIWFGVLVLSFFVFHNVKGIFSMNNNKEQNMQQTVEGNLRDTFGELLRSAFIR